MKIAIITGVYGFYDPIRNLPKDHGFDDAICVTDTGKLLRPSTSSIGNGWRVVIQGSTMEPRMTVGFVLVLLMKWKYVGIGLSI